MKIMTFNILHALDEYGTGQIDHQKYADYIKSVKPDVLGLNEVRAHSNSRQRFHNQTAILSSLTDMSYCFFAKAIKDLQYGNAILSKICIKEVQNIEIPDPEVRRFDNNDYETRCLIKAKLENGLTVFITHFGLNHDEHENAVKTILENLEPEKCILMGDFNVTPDSPVLAPIREKMKDTADVFSKPLLSFPADAPDIKIDYIFTDGKCDNAYLVEDVAINGQYYSDHNAVVAEIEL